MMTEHENRVKRFSLESGRVALDFDKGKWWVDVDNNGLCGDRSMESVEALTELEKLEMDIRDILNTMKFGVLDLNRIAEDHSKPFPGETDFLFDDENEEKEEKEGENECQKD